MSEPSQEFTHESLEDGPSIEKYLRAVIDGLIQKRLSLAVDDKKLTLEPKGPLHFTLKARRGRHRSHVILKIGWPEEDPIGATGGVIIQS